MCRCGTDSRVQRPICRRCRGCDNCRCICRDKKKLAAYRAEQRAKRRARKAAK